MYTYLVEHEGIISDNDYHDYRIFGDYNPYYLLMDNAVILIVFSFLIIMISVVVAFVAGKFYAQLNEHKHDIAI